LANFAGTSGVYVDVTTDGTLKILTRGLVDTAILNVNAAVLSGKLSSTGTSPTALVTGNTTFAVTSNLATITGTNAVTIATITGGVSGMELHLLFVDGNVTITDTDGTGTTDSVNLAGTSTNFTSGAQKTLTIIHNGTKWYEIARSTN
jgi:hypothetical protein